MADRDTNAFGRRVSRGLRYIIPLALVALACLALFAIRMHRTAQEQQLLSALPDKVLDQPDALRLATRIAVPIFARQCAGCHGDDMKGRVSIGAPNLTDRVSLYGNDVARIERIILYGIRSGHPKAANIADMPAIGQLGRLGEADIGDVIQYVLQLSGRKYDAGAAASGQRIFATTGSCYDCHGSDGAGNADYGAPDLTANIWNYGGSPAALHDSIYYGRHGIMPGWSGKLSPLQIRALAVYVHASAQR